MGAHLREQLCDTIFEGLTANKTGRGVQPRLRHKMLTPSKPHLEGKVSSPGEQHPEVKRPLRKAVINAEIGKKRLLIGA